MRIIADVSIKCTAVYLLRRTENVQVRMRSLASLGCRESSKIAF